MRYSSTRGGVAAVTAGAAIEKGLAGDGGLYVPENIPAFGQPLAELCRLAYAELAIAVLRDYLTDYPEADAHAYIRAAYAYPGVFSHPEVAPLRKLDDTTFFLELFHGPTLAFKDMALSLLPALLTSAAARERPGTRTVVLTATSGDTGKAALQGFAGAKDVSVAVFYPLDGVSDMQKKQMLTQEGDNTRVIGVRGNFDDAQTGVKHIFNDTVLAARMRRDGLVFSSANSINIGRLLPQIVYYVYAYGRLCAQRVIPVGGAVDFTVPTGNFGNILAGYYARRMGLPIRRLLCASNANNVLTDFFADGVYDANRAFFSTISPSMDILVSSNLERLLYHISGDAACVRDCMTGLKTAGQYRFDRALPGFEAAYATESETRDALRAVWDKGCLIDPHTAVAYHAYKKLDDGAVPNVIIATASPYKFAGDVYAALSGEIVTGFAALPALEKLTGVPVPPALQALETKPIRHTAVCDTGDMLRTLESVGIFDAP